MKSRSSGPSSRPSDAYRHPPVASALNEKLVSRITELTHLRLRFGYRGIRDVLRPGLPGHQP